MLASAARKPGRYRRRQARKEVGPIIPKQLCVKSIFRGHFSWAPLSVADHFIHRDSSLVLPDSSKQRERRQAIGSSETIWGVVFLRHMKNGASVLLSAAQKANQ